MGDGTPEVWDTLAGAILVVMVLPELAKLYSCKTIGMFGAWSKPPQPATLQLPQLWQPI
jgi:hypothetical protein